MRHLQALKCRGKACCTFWLSMHKKRDAVKLTECTSDAPLVVVSFELEVAKVHGLVPILASAAHI